MKFDSFIPHVQSAPQFGIDDGANQRQEARQHKDRPVLDALLSG